MVDNEFRLYYRFRKTACQLSQARCDVETPVEIGDVKAPVEGGASRD